MIVHTHKMGMSYSFDTSSVCGLQTTTQVDYAYVPNYKS